VLDDVEKGTILIKQKTEMGFISGAGLYDKGSNEEDKELDDLSNKIESNTRLVAEMVFPGDAIQQNRLYHHLILTQKLIIYDRLDYSQSS
jgi:hypothetical protein